MDTLYSKIGQERLHQVLVLFYDKVFQSAIIGPLFKGEKEEILEKQELFLTQFLGGPQLYSQKFGHPRMRARHLPHAITNEGKEEWLRLMKQSIDEVFEGDHLGEALYNCFPQVAQHMVNR